MSVDVDFLSKVALFASFDEGELNVLAGTVESRTVTAGQVLFRLGEPGESMYVVVRGAIELYVQDTSGEKILFHTALPGDYFGEVSLFDEGSRTATAAAVEETELVMLDRDDLLGLFTKRPAAALHMLAGMGAMTRKADAMLRQRVTRNVNEEISEHATLLQRIADGIAAFSGSMPFLLGNAGAFALWIGWNTIPLFNHFDPYPFGLLTMIVSLEAIFLSCFVLISQDRQGAKERVRSDIEYNINVKAELEVAHLHEKTDRMYEDMMGRFAQLEKHLVTKRKEGAPSASTSIPG